MTATALRTIAFRASLVTRFVAGFFVSLLLVSTTPCGAADVPSDVHSDGLSDVLTWHNDSAHHGLNNAETTLTPANVNDRLFGRLFSFTTDGYAYAQPLVVSDLEFPGVGKRTAVFVATEHDSVYAFDAAGNSGASSILWHASLIDPEHRITPVPCGDVKTQDLVPEIGITSTPAIDRVNHTIYVVTRTKEYRLQPAASPPTQIATNQIATTQIATTQIASTQPLVNQPSTRPSTQPVVMVTLPHWVQKLHALDLLTGNEMPGSPVVIGDSYRDSLGHWQDNTAVQVPGTGAGNVNGVVHFNALREHQRSGLLLDHGHLYIDYASHGDNEPVHGWILAFDARSLHLLASLCTSPNGSLSTSWMAGASPAVDADGNLYFATGNGEFTASTGGHDYGESVLRVDTRDVASGTLSVSDYFTPSNFAALNAHDLDLGSGGLMMLPDIQSTATTQPLHRHRLILGGKEGILFVLDADQLGGVSPGPEATAGHAVQILKSLGHMEAATHHEINIINTPACFNGWLYYTSRDDPLTQFEIASDGTLNPEPIHRASDHFNFAPPTPSISSNGNRDGIVWAINNGVPATLLAYDAADVSHKLFDSSSAGSRDRLDGGVKFSLPTIADGKVFVPTQDNLTVFGLLPAAKIRPLEPTDLTATVIDAHHVDLLWHTNDHSETGFRIERAANNDAFGPLDTAGRGTTSYADHAESSSSNRVMPETVYRYRIAAVNAAGESHWIECQPVTTPPAPPDRALIGHWAMDEGTGARVADSAESPDDGTVHGEVVWAHGHVGPGALGFHGAGVAPGYVEIADAPKLHFTDHDSFTISAWVEPAAPPDKWAAIVARAGDDPNGIGLWSDDQNHWAFGTPGGQHNVVGGTATIGWHHLVGVQDATAKRRVLYVDGTQVADVAGTFDASAAGDLWIGGSKSDETKFIDARIDDVQLYNRDLSADEIRSLFVHHNPPALIRLFAELHGGKPTELTWVLPEAEANALPSTLRLERSVAGSPFSLIERLSNTATHALDANLPTSAAACTYRIALENSVGDSDPLTAIASGRPTPSLIRSIIEQNAAHPAVVVGGWREHDPLFVDRDFLTNTVLAQSSIATAVPIDLVGADVIRMANDDKHNSNYQLTYTLAGDADVYLLVDQRTIPYPGLPAGAETFTDTQAHLDFISPGPFDVFHARQSAGTYTLHSQVSSDCFYFIAALPAK